MKRFLPLLALALITTTHLGATDKKAVARELRLKDILNAQTQIKVNALAMRLAALARKNTQIQDDILDLAKKIENTPKLSWQTLTIGHVRSLYKKLFSRLCAIEERLGTLAESAEEYHTMAQVRLIRETVDAMVQEFFRMIEIIALITFQETTHANTILVAELLKAEAEARENFAKIVQKHDDLQKRLTTFASTFADITVVDSLSVAVELCTKVMQEAHAVVEILKTKELTEEEKQDLLYQEMCQAALMQYIPKMVYLTRKLESAL